MKEWLTTLSHLGRHILLHKNTIAVGVSVLNYSYKTVDYLFVQMGLIPKILHSIVTKAPTRTVAKHLLRIGTEDLIPLVLVTFTHDQLQKRATTYLEKEPEDSWLSTETLLQAGLYLLQAAVWVYTVRKKTQLLVRSTILTLEAPFLLNQIKSGLPMTVCIDEKCSSLRFAQGSMRDLVSYWATEVAISGVWYVPSVGSTLSSVLYVYHRGRYVLTIALPNVCHLHQMTYLKEHSELALSLGIGHALTCWCALSLSERFTGIPSIYYRGAIEQFLLINQINMATHMTLPVAPNKSLRLLPDPVFLYQQFIGLIFDFLLFLLEKKLLPMLNGKQPSNLVAYLRSIPYASMLEHVKKLHQTRTLRLLLPQLLHNTNALINDPIIKYHWPDVQMMIVTVVKTIEGLHDNAAIRAASSMSDVTSKVLSYFGTPEYVTKLLLQLLTNTQFIKKLRTTRYAIERLNLTPPRPELAIWNAGALPMRTPAVIASSPLFLDSDTVLVNLSEPRALLPFTTPDPCVLPILVDIAPSSSPQQASAAPITTAASIAALPLSLPSPETVIRKRNGCLFFATMPGKSGDIDNHITLSSPTLSLV